MKVTGAVLSGEMLSLGLDKLRVISLAGHPGEKSCPVKIDLCIVLKCIYLAVRVDDVSEKDVAKRARA